MLKRTFIHLPGVGPRREAHFWSQGVETWEDFLAAQWISGLSRERFRESPAVICGNPSSTRPSLPTLPRFWPRSEHWRLFRTCRPRVGYLDIETTGSFWPGLQVTVAGLYDGVTMRQFVQGYNLQEFPQGGATETFAVVDTIDAADWKPRQLSSGEAVRVATGAALPCGGLRVVMQEHVERDGDQLRVVRREDSTNIRLRGEEVRQGQPLVSAGTN